MYMTKDELVMLIAENVPEYLDIDRQSRGFFAGVCDGSQTQLMLGGDNASQILGAFFGMICQIASRANMTPREVIEVLEEMADNEDKKFN